MQNIETKWLLDFLKLAELRNFSKAAEERHITQSTFSRRIQALENAVGCPLFDRDTTPVTLTQSGIEFRSSARSLVIQLEYDLERLSDLSVLGHQKVSLAAGHSIATDILPLMNFNLFSEDTETILEVRAIDIDDAVKMLQESACDLVMSYKNVQLHHANYLTHKLGESKMLCVTGVDALGNGKYHLSRDILSPWIMHSSGSFMGRLTREMGHYYALRPVFSSSMTELVKALIIQGEGIGWLPEHSIKQALSNGQLLVLDQEQAPPIAEIYAYRSMAKLHHAAERVWQKLKGYSNIDW